MEREVANGCLPVYDLVEVTTPYLRWVRQDDLGFRPGDTQHSGGHETIEVSVGDDSLDVESVEQGVGCH